MNERRILSALRYAMAGVVLSCMVLGGGTAPSLPVDAGLQFVMILVAMLAILALHKKPVDRRIWWLLSLSIGCVILQFLPLPVSWLDNSQGVLPDAANTATDTATFRMTTLVPGRTLESLGWVIAHGLLLVAMTRMPMVELAGLIPFFLLGVSFNLLVAFVQFMSKGAQNVEIFTGVSAAAGFFANSNHFSLLAIASIPLAISYFLGNGRRILLVSFVLFLSLVLLAAGSQFGVIGGIAALLGSTLLVFPRRRLPVVLLAALAIVLAIVVFGAATKFSSGGIEPGERGAIAHTTLTAIVDNLPFGVGFGGFLTTYPAYETIQAISREYINHAHNDYLELALEGGVPAIVALLAAFVLTASRMIEMRASSFQRGVALAILLVFVHSMVDYPLRTMAISTTLVLFLGFLFNNTGKRTRNKNEFAIYDQHPRNETQSM